MTLTGTREGPAPCTACPEVKAAAWVAVRGQLREVGGTQVYRCDPVPQPQEMGEGRGRGERDGAGTTGESQRGGYTQDTEGQHRRGRDCVRNKNCSSRRLTRGQTWQGARRGQGREDPAPLSGAATPRHPRLPPGIGTWGSSCRDCGGAHIDGCPTASPNSRVVGRPLSPAPGGTSTPGIGERAGASPGLLPDPGRADLGTGHGVGAGAAGAGPDSRRSPAEPLPGTWAWHPPRATYLVQG